MGNINASADLRRDGEIAIVTVDNPPVNALKHEVRAGLTEALRQTAEDAAVKGVVIACAGRTFFAGADITEFGKPPQAPGLGEVITAIEAMPKPVIAALHGTALGGGFELALACHFRVAVPSARVGLPEVKLGLLPGAGGTQRLPRLIGPEKALKMIVTGDPIEAREALADGIVDEIVEGDLTAGAIAFARRGRVFWLGLPGNPVSASVAFQVLSSRGRKSHLDGLPSIEQQEERPTGRHDDTC